MPTLQEALNPAGLSLLEDKWGAVAYGWVAPRVFYGRFVGELRTELATTFVDRLRAHVAGVPSLLYFSDVSALGACDALGRDSFERFVLAHRAKFGAVVELTCVPGASLAARGLGLLLGESVHRFTDPFEFDQRLSNVAAATDRRVAPLSYLWQAYARPGATANEAR